MPRSQNQLAIGLCVASAVAGWFLLLSDLAEPLRLERSLVELALQVPLLSWLLVRRLRVGH